MTIFTTFLFLVAGNAWAVGPVDVGSVPGGATVSDSDGGSGEQWGRLGGRDLDYSGFNIANFTSLNWQPLAAGMAFDGDITGATDEEMAGPVQTSQNTLRWTGETNITDASLGNVIVPVYTRLTVMASENFIGPPDNIDIIAAVGSFSINILFEASLAAGGPWEPALDFFDAFETPIGHDGFAHTSFDSGFFYEVLEGMSIEEHDSNMQDRFDDVDGSLSYLTIETVNRLIGIAATVDDNNFKIDWIKIDLEELLNAGPGDAATLQEIQDLINNLMSFISDEVSDLRDRFSETDALILCLWVGNELFEICPPEAPAGLPNLLGLMAGQADLMDKLLWAKTDLESLGNKADAVQASIDGLTTDLAALSAEVAGTEAIEVTAMKSNKASNSDYTFMVLTSLNGLPTDTEITSVTAVTESNRDGIGAEPLSFSSSAVSTGLVGLEVSLPGKLSSIKTLLITVEYADGGGNTLHGSTLISN